MTLGTDVNVDVRRQRLRDKIEHLKDRMKMMRRDPKCKKLHQWAKVELSVAERRLEALDKPTQSIGGE